MTYAPGTNTGHGHVWERPDGVKTRCGGPGICPECSADQVDRDRAAKVAPEVAGAIKEIAEPCYQEDRKAERPTIASGDVVQLRSGGAQMTVAYVSKNSLKIPFAHILDYGRDPETLMAYCVWHDSDGHDQSHTYPLFMLEKNS